MQHNASLLIGLAAVETVVGTAVVTAGAALQFTYSIGTISGLRATPSVELFGGCRHSLGIAETPEKTLHEYEREVADGN
jgi:hypothetical protein